MATRSPPPPALPEVQHPEQFEALVASFATTGSGTLVHPELAERPVGAWKCLCGVECGPTLIICPGCSLSIHDQPPVFAVKCEGCGHVHTSATDPGPFTRCDECGQRTAHGTLVGRWVIHPMPPHFLRIDVTVGAEQRSYVLDLLHGCCVAKDILSIGLPGVT